MISRPSLDAVLEAIADGRAAAPLDPVTVVCPSHLAALGLRRRLAELTPFAAVRFETLPRLAELIAAGDLAAAGRRPMARPIGDHLAERIGADARPPLAPIRALPGFGRALRRLFDRLRRGGLAGGETAPEACGPHLAEVVRLYGGWREATAGFYDEDDLLDAAADALAADPGRARELGRLHLVPPGPRSASGARLLTALTDACGGLVTAADPPPADDVGVLLAPDRSSEAREAARAVVAALGDGVAVDRIAVLHGADRAYARLLREALAAAGVPVAATPGIPLSETPAGRGVLALLDVAREDLSRTALIDALSVAPVRRDLPAGRGRAAVRLGRWDRISRAAGVTHGRRRWREGIGALCDERRARMAAAEREGGDLSWLQDEIDDAEIHLEVVGTLADRLAELAPEQAAAGFLGRLRALVADYLDPGATGMDEVLAEVDRLGTIDAVGGTFTLPGFQEALRVNLDAAAIREGRAGEGVLIADHRVAGGLRFDLVVVCGAAEGLLPAGPGADTLVDDRAWQALREAGHPYVEDAGRRITRAREAAARAVGAGRRVLLTCPLYEGAGAHEHYPSPIALEAAQRRDPSIPTATALREHAGGDGSGWLTRVRSPLAAQLRGPVLDPWEAGLRAAVARVQAGGAPPAPDPIARPLAMLRARAGSALTEWDGNLAALAGSDWLAVPGVVSPTRLEQYGGCGFRFLLSSLLDVRVPDEPADAETIDPVVRGSIVHDTLEAFFREQQARSRPAPGERWTAADDARLQELLSERLEAARRLGLTGLAVFAGDAERTMRADLTAFLIADGDFRGATGATPWKFEEPVRDAVGPHGQRFRGRVDRIDRILPDGPAWVIDYKTGRVPEKDDQLGGGRLLQLPVYLLATTGIPATARYWYITARGDFTTVPFDPTPENLIRFADVVAAIRAGVAAGAFPASPGAWNDFYAEFENCGRCDFTRICARSRGDDFDRKEADAGVAPWSGVKAAAAGVP